MLNLPPPGKVKCPFCRKEFDLMGQTAVSLQTNQHALHVIELDKAITELNKTNTKLGGANKVLMNTNVELENALNNVRYKDLILVFVLCIDVNVTDKIFKPYKSTGYGVWCVTNWLDLAVMKRSTW